MFSAVAVVERFKVRSDSDVGNTAFVSRNEEGAPARATTRSAGPWAK